jgi:phytoene dehydrogenase-like protein
MDKYDVVVIGAGMAGLTTGALLAKEGKSVAVFEKGTVPGGRALEVVDDDFKILLGGHLLEDSGSGITKIMEHLGKELVHGEINAEMPVWDHDGGRWQSIRDRYQVEDRSEMRRFVERVIETPFEDFDDWDDRPLRAWMTQHTQDQGIIDLFEFLAMLEYLTDKPEDHAASENLYSRKMHYMEKGMAGYSFWPEQGWDGMVADLADALVEHGGTLELGVAASRVVIENGEVKGVLVDRGTKTLPNQILGEDFVEAPCVVSTLPVWNVLDVVPPEALPDWYTGQIRYLAQDKYRVSWLGLYAATEEPIFHYDPRELAAWMHDPVAGLAGWFFTQSAVDPASAPEGLHLHIMGGIIDPTRATDQSYVREIFPKWEEGLYQMYPGLRNQVWRRPHLVHNPSYNVIQKPMLVGKYRPHWRAPNVDGLYFASETFRSRGVGVDRASRAGLTVAEDYLGRRLPGFEETWRY